VLEEMQESINSPYDVIVVGLGPAAVTAGLYSLRNNLKTLMIGETFGGATLVSGEIENWPGTVNTNGFELAEKFEEQIMRYCQDGACLKRSLVQKIEKKGNPFNVVDKEGNEYLAKTVIYSTGSESRKLNIPGESEYRNKGVTYCATCDGPLYKGKDVAIIGGGNSAMKAALMMKNIAKSLVVVSINPKLSGEQISIAQVEKTAAEGKLRLIVSGKTKELGGNGKFVDKIFVEHTDTGKTEEIAVQGVFVEIGLIPITNPVKELGLEFNQIGEIVTDREMVTNIPGFFAAGDVSDVRDKQIIVAAGTGCVAALSAADYLSKI
jgi:alkyl hydroperoxide reductase subunit F